eukprot:gene19224-19607_t
MSSAPAFGLNAPQSEAHLTVSTFHSLGVKILRQEAQHLGLKDRFSIMDSDDCFSLVQDLAVTTDKQLIRRIQSAMSLWKNGLVDPEVALKQAVDEDEAQAARIYRSYVLAMDDDEAEADQVAIMLSAHRFERHAKFSDYAILYRGNHQARIIEKSLRRERIPYVMSGGQSYFDRAEIKDIISYLRLIANQEDDPAFIRAVTTPRRGIGQATLEALGTVAGQWQCSLFEAVYKGGIEEKLPDKQLRPLRQFCDFINQMESRASRPGPSGSGENAGQVLNDLMEAINYEGYVYDAFDERQAQSKWQNVLEFINWLKERACGGKDGSGEEKNVLELTQMVALMTMLEGKDEDPDARRKRAREYVACDMSRFIHEMRLNVGNAVPTEEEQITPQNRLANLKALLQKPRPS